ncbi:hypothetical protein, partial [Paenibacillus sp. HGF7]|uniref:tetratricopeptide repeat protein n=2 Tax=Paenibacillus TaxID=44249 RepID=UPI00055CEB47
GDFKEAKNMVRESDYRQALNFRETGKFTESITAFYQLGDYRDSLEQEKESRLQLGNSFFENKEYDKAVAQFDPIKNYKEATEKYTESVYQLSLVHLKKEKFNEAAANFEKLGDYKDSKNQLIESKYQIAANMKGSRKELEQAREIFKELGNYKDSAAKAENMSTALKWHGRWYKIRYDQWVGGTVESDKTYGPFGKEPFYDYIDIDFYNNKMVEFSDIATLNFDLAISGNTLTRDFYGNKDKYVLKGNKLVFEELGHVTKYRVTYVREDVKDQEKP